MLKAINIMANSRKRPLEVLIPGLRDAGSLIRFPKMIPMTRASSIALKPNQSPRNIAPVAIASVNKTPLSILVTVGNIKILFC